MEIQEKCLSLKLNGLRLPRPWQASYLKGQVMNAGFQYNPLTTADPQADCKVELVFDLRDGATGGLGILFRGAEASLPDLSSRPGILIRGEQSQFDYYGDRLPAVILLAKVDGQDGTHCLGFNPRGWNCLLTADRLATLATLPVFTYTDGASVPEFLYETTNTAQAVATRLMLPLVDLSGLRMWPPDSVRRFINERCGNDPMLNGLWEYLGRS